jgi:hypothetical protein
MVLPIYLFSILEGVKSIMTKYKTELKWGIYFFIMGLLWMMMEYILGWHDAQIDQQPLFTNLFAIPAIFLYVFALRDKRKNDFGGEMTYQQGFVSGVAISIVVMLLSPVSQLLAYYIISRNYFKNAIVFVVSTNRMSQEAAESYYSLKSYIVQGMVGAPVMGIITSAVVAFFTKTKQQKNS